MLPKRINNIIYGPKIDIVLDKRGLGRMIFEKMKEYKDRVLQVTSIHYYSRLHSIFFLS